MREIVLIVTAAGLGRRLKEYSLKKYGKYVDKPLVKLKDNSLLEWSIKPFFPLITYGILKFSDIFIVIREDQDEEKFKKEISNINEKINIIKIDKLSRGSAHTAYEACKKISKIKSIERSTLVVCDSDHTFRSDALLNFFKDNSKSKYNSFCTLKSVLNPEKWGYVIKNDKNHYISGEKDILSKSNDDIKKAEYLIGCYIYHDLVSLKKGINEFESLNLIDRESHHSLVLSLLSKHETVHNVTSDWGIGLGTPIQLESAEKSLISFEGNREPSTYIFDIDGVIFKHDKGNFSKTGYFEEKPRPIEENINLINKLFDSGSHIVLLSSRSDSIFKKTEEDLKKSGLKFHKLVLGSTSGVRYLINDVKPSNKAINTSISVNTIRDQPIKDDLSEKFDFLKDTTKGSGASTTILKNQESGKTIVRKWTNSENQNVCKTLYRQFSYIKLMRNYINNSVPEILNWNFCSKGISYYDMKFIDGKNLSLNKVQNNPIYLENLCNILCSLYESNPISKSHKDYSGLLRKIIEKKLKPIINQSENIFKNKLDDPNISFNFLENLNNGLDKLLKINNLWLSHRESLIHGDLTFENIFMKSNSIYLIDPLGSTMDIRCNGSMQQLTSPIFDIGKIFQSMISKV